MNISSINIPVTLFGLTPNTSKPASLSAVAQSINDAVSAAASKRKELAAKRLEGLQDRLKVMMMFAALGTKGNAKAAAQIAKEIAGAVKEYADASKDIANSDAQGLPGLNQEDEKFLNVAKGLSYQVKAIITFEAARTKYQERHQKEINQMDSAINDAEKSLRHDRVADLYAFNGSTLALLKSHFSASA